MLQDYVPRIDKACSQSKKLYAPIIIHIVFMNFQLISVVHLHDERYFFQCTNNLNYGRGQKEVYIHIVGVQSLLQRLCYIFIAICVR